MDSESVFYQAMLKLYEIEQGRRIAPPWVAKSPKAHLRWQADRNYRQACLRAQDRQDGTMMRRLLDIAES